MGQATFWDNQDKAKKTILQLKPLNALLKPYEELQASVADIHTMAELAEADEELAAELESALPEAETHRRVRIPGDAFGPARCVKRLSAFQAGAGGTDACDSAQMLLRMYAAGRSAMASKSGSKTKSRMKKPAFSRARSASPATMPTAICRASRACIGLCASVRLAPATRGKPASRLWMSRQNSTTRSKSTCATAISGATRFARAVPAGSIRTRPNQGVRYTHTPTGVAAESRTERSQVKNDANALALLKAKLYKLEEQKRLAAVDRVYDEKGEVAFGSQIRNYVLQPYTLVKDVRTDCETAQVNKVLDGDLDEFMHAFLRMKTEKQHRKSK